MPLQDAARGEGEYNVEMDILFATQPPPVLPQMRTITEFGGGK